MADDNPPQPAPPKASMAQRLRSSLARPAVARAVLLGVVVLIGLAAVGLKNRLSLQVVKVKVPVAAAKDPRPAPKPTAKPAASKQAPAPDPEAARKTIEERYALGAKALMAQDLPSFLTLRAPNFQCKQPETKETQAAPSVASTTLAAFEVSTVTIQGDQLVVDNVEKIVQKVRTSANAPRLMRSEIRRRDTWVRMEGGWRLLQTERLGFTKPAPVIASGKDARFPGERSNAEMSDQEPEPDEKIAENCYNEIGILCYSVRGDIKAAKKCLNKYEGSWLTGCKKAIRGPEIDTEPDPRP